jgi:monoamine oxidase
MKREAIFDVIVVGGGVAGIAAASALSSFKHSVLLLEARNRLGGLVYSEQSVLGVVEHGAEFLHDTNHPIADLLKNAGAILRPVPSAVLYARDGALLSDSDPWVQAVRRIKQHIAAHSGTSVAVSELLNSLAAEYPADALDRTANAISSHEGAPIDELSMAALEYDADILTEHARVEGGLSLLVESLASGFTYRLGMEIARLNHGADGVTLFDAHGECVGRGRCAVVAVPLGVLQSGSITFDPCLDAGHQAALASLRMNHTVKIILHFSEQIFGEERFLSLPGPVPEIWSRSCKHGEMLVGFSGGQLITMYQELFHNQEALIKNLLATLSELFGPKVERAFVSSRVVDWLEDPFARGSCSYSASGSTGRDIEARQALAQPIENRLFFCGEATNYSGAHGTVHGAYDTGIRVAREIHARKHALEGSQFGSG